MAYGEMEEPGVDHGYYEAAGELASSREEELVDYYKSIKSPSDILKLQKHLNANLGGYEIVPDLDSLDLTGQFDPNTREYLRADIDMSIGPDRREEIINQIVLNLNENSKERQIMKQFLGF